MPHDVTQLLLDWSDGDETAVDKLLPVVYDELRHLAARFLRQERTDHTLQPTALVHEAYLRLVNQQQVEMKNRAQFFGLAAQVMRNILVSHARQHLSAKRGDGARKVSLEDVTGGYTNERAAELVALDDALQELEKFDSRKSRIVQLRYFGGLSLEEIEAVVGVSAATIRRDLRMAEVWLYKSMQTAG
ncbi:sigma-70 family RNA polymerase sigma factor [soil metagenome]|nr:sigma-70 family RNA polymerase sigma factor [Pyrinomonadaceae bacterium]